MNACENPVVICPKCESEYVVRIHRFRVEKWVTSKCKYQCTDCGKQFFLLMSKVIPSNHKTSPPSESYFNFYRS